jgi:hypothetical protein
MNPSNVVSSVHFLKKPEDIGSLPVLTDVLVASTTPSGRTLWLAWDERRVPVLDEVVDAPPAVAYTPMRMWRSR